MGRGGALEAESVPGYSGSWGLLSTRSWVHQEEGSQGSLDQVCMLILVQFRHSTSQSKELGLSRRRGTREPCAGVHAFFLKWYYYACYYSCACSYDYSYDYSYAYSYDDSLCLFLCLLLCLFSWTLANTTTECWSVCVLVFVVTMTIIVLTYAYFYAYS